MRVLVFSLLLFVLPARAQHEFVVNTRMEFDQRDPQIAGTGAGEYVVVWMSEMLENGRSWSNIAYQLMNAGFERVGTETLVSNVTQNHREQPAVAMNRNHDFIIVWTEHTGMESIFDIKGQIYRNGIPYGEVFLVNTTTAYSQTSPSVAINDDGAFIVVWDSWYEDGSDKGVVGQRFDPDGNRVGENFPVNTTTTFSQARPEVKYTVDDHFIVIWESWKQDILTPSGYGLFGQLFDAEASRVGDEFQINTYTNDYQWFGDVETFYDGSFVVVWCSWEQDGDDGGIYLQRFDADAQKTGGEISVNKNVSNYQWLPRITQLANENLAVVWSSWKQDGSREGVYARIFNAFGQPVSLESQVNLTTDSFQWEPVVTGTIDNELLTVWSSWGQYNDDYDIIARKMNPVIPIGSIDEDTIVAGSGVSTSGLFIHVTDRNKLNGNTYEISFSTPGGEGVLSTSILNLGTQQTVISGLLLDRGENAYYLSPQFDGMMVEIIPEFDLEIDLDGSFFGNSTGATVSFNIENITDYRNNVAPIDIELVWGNTDTLANGQYAAPLDTALFEVKIPFKAWNTTDNSGLDIWVIEKSDSRNQRWDISETFRILTPPPYQQAPSDAHVQISANVPEVPFVLPGVGDTLFIYTHRPLTTDDTFRFTASDEYLVTGTRPQTELAGDRVRLEQNYPNPFNPTSTISYYLPAAGEVNISVYNVVGQRVGTLVETFQTEGTHRVLFDASGMASGVYFYTLNFEQYSLARKMVLIK